MNAVPCRLDWCDRPRRSGDGLCAAHAQRARDGRDLRAPIRRRNQRDKVCSVKGCTRARRDADYCPMHRDRVRRNGDAGEPEPRVVQGVGPWAAGARPDKTPENLRRWRIGRSYGMTLEDYDAMVAAQGDRCAICGTDDPTNARIRRWCIDHDHATGAVRGLLCARCNRALGMFRDDPEILEAARRYLLAARTEATA